MSRERRNRLRLNERAIVESVRQLRSEAPGIGAYKLFLILKGIFPDAVPGRDRFYDIIRRNHLMLKPERRRPRPIPTITTASTRTSPRASHPYVPTACGSPTSRTSKRTAGWFTCTS